VRLELTHTRTIAGPPLFSFLHPRLVAFVDTGVDNGCVVLWDGQNAGLRWLLSKARRRRYAVRIGLRFWARSTAAVAG
jgi:hypothetical protein